MISLIVAVAENGVIGDRNALLWHISEDLRHFKAVTASDTLRISPWHPAPLIRLMP